MTAVGDYLILAVRTLLVAPDDPVLADVRRRHVQRMERRSGIDRRAVRRDMLDRRSAEGGAFAYGVD